MSNLLGDLAESLFEVTEKSTLRRKCTLLELGSGLGRAGIMAAKIMENGANGGICVFSDGELDVVQLLKSNCTLNELSRDQTIVGNDEEKVDCSCHQLFWGENESQRDLKKLFPNGFDIIIGMFR